MIKPFARLLLFLAVLYSQDTVAQAICGFNALHDKAMNTDTAYRNTMQLNEARIRTIIAEQEARKATAPSNARVNDANATLYTIPVVVHVVHTGDALGSTYNPNDSKITAAINYLNQIYAGTYPGTEGVGEIQIQFALATRDPNCNTTNGIDRLNGSAIPNYQANGVNAQTTAGATELQLKNSSRWDPYSYYNIWVVHKIDGADGTVPFQQFIAGYARFAGGSPLLDGTIMLASQMDAGFKTLPHEIGHALNLYHPFQDSDDNTDCPSATNCATTGDFVCDTDPITYNATPAPGGIIDFSCRTGNNSCTGTNYSINTEHNIMNYTNCFTLFTAGQKARMLAAMSFSGRREYAGSWALSGSTYPVTYSAPALNCTPNTIDPSANFAGILEVRLGNKYFYSGYPSQDGAGAFINRASSCLNLIPLQENGSYTLSTILSCSNYEQLAAWIDYDNDGVLEASEALVLTDFIPNGGPRSVSVPFTIPAGAVKGQVLRMRVMDEVSTGYGSGFAITGACYTPSYGQAEDFAVLISPSALPLTMEYFKGFKQGPTNKLFWKTVSEVNTNLFEIERSYNGIDYTQIGTVEATGNHTGSTYSYDDNTYTGAVVYYRLKQVDLNGNFTYSNIVIIKSDAVTEASVQVLNNPFHDQFQLSLASPAQSKVNIRMLDATGKLVHAQSETVSGNTIISIQPRGKSLSAGVYIVQVQLNGQTFTKKVIKD